MFIAARGRAALVGLVCPWGASELNVVLTKEESWILSFLELKLCASNDRFKMPVSLHMSGLDDPVWLPVWHTGTYTHTDKQTKRRAAHQLTCPARLPAPFLLVSSFFMKCRKQAPGIDSFVMRIF